MMTWRIEIWTVLLQTEGVQYMMDFYYNEIYIRREFKAREESNIVKNLKETDIVGNKNDENEVEKEKLTEDKFKRETRKSTKSNKSLTLPLDPMKRKDSDSSSCDLSKVEVEYFKDDILTLIIHFLRCPHLQGACLLLGSGQLEENSFMSLNMKIGRRWTLQNLFQSGYVSFLSLEFFLEVSMPIHQNLHKLEQ